MTMHEIGIKYETDKATHHKYCDFYQKHLPDRDFSGRLLEIGVMHGSSLAMWSEYYPNADIVGIDIYDKRTIDTRAKFYITDATNINQLKKLGNFDIIIDDGSHMTTHQQTSFNHLYYNQLNKDGYYILEDLHTSLMQNYTDSKKTTLEFLDELDLEIIHFRRNPKEKDSMTAIIRA